MPIGDYRLVLNASMNELGKRCRRPQWRKYGSGSPFGFNNQDLHEQLFCSDYYYDMNLFYTLDGSTPTSSSPPYTGPISLEDGYTLRIIAINGPVESDVAVAIPDCSGAIGDVLVLMNNEIAASPAVNWSLGDLGTPDLLRVEFGALTELTSPGTGVNNFRIQFNDNLVSVEMTALTTITEAALRINSNDVLASINLPLLSELLLDGISGGELEIDGNPLLTEILLPSLITIGDESELDINNNASLVTLDLSSLTTIGADGLLSVTSNTALTTLDVTGLLNVASEGGIAFNGCSSLVAPQFGNFVLTNNHFINCPGCAFDAATVNFILARAVAAASYVAGTINLSGGTSAAPTGQGVADKATLQGRGITVNTN